MAVPTVLRLVFVAWYEATCATQAPSFSPAPTPRPTVTCASVAFSARAVAVATDDAFVGAASVVAVDVDSDGDVDALWASYSDDTVAWHENDGAQSFAERVVTTLADGTQYTFATDVDGDGDTDVNRLFT